MKQQMAEYQAAHDAVTNQQYTAEREAHQLAMQVRMCLPGGWSLAPH